MIIGGYQIKQICITREVVPIVGWEIISHSLSIQNVFWH